MPHQCVRCNKFYDDGSKEILTGCKCGGRLFFYIKKEKLKKIKALSANLTTTEKKQIEEDVFDILGSEIGANEPVVLDLESIRILKPGKYELDLVQLFKKEPLIYKVDDGKYIIDVIRSFGIGTKEKE
ncbi:MAG: hypothetical protein GY861_19615 [bacterium]|nr:hypothetical protein [bacterium]